MWCSKILNFEYSAYAKSEGISIFLKTIVLYLLVSFEICGNLEAFALAQFTESSFFFVFSLFVNNLRSKETVKFNFRFRKINESNYLHPEQKELAVHLSIISILRYLLTEIEKLVLVIFQTTAFVSSEFALVSNLGAMIPRYFYMPLEVYLSLNSGNFLQSFLKAGKSLQSEQTIRLSIPKQRE